jgi:hypothetical protein
VGKGPVIPFNCAYLLKKVQQNLIATQEDLSGLGLLQLFPTPFQGGGELPPNLQVLLESTVCITLLPHSGEFFLFDIGELGAAVLGARNVVCWPRSRRAAGAQMTLDHRTGAHGLRLQQLRFDRAPLCL